jgi:hypothetical protein
LPVVLVLTLLVSLYSVHRRYVAEIENRTTALAVEYETVEALAAAQGVSTERALTDLKAQGVTSLVLSEGYLGDMITSGRGTIVSVSTGPGVPLSSGLRLTDVRQLHRIQQGLRIRFKDLAGDLVPRGDTLALPPVAPLVLRQTPIGLDPDQVAIAQKLRLEIIGRCSNPPGLSSSGVRETLQWLKDSGADVFLPMGEQVIGRRDSLVTTEATLLSLGIRYASPEFTKISGDTEMVEDSPENVIRLHTAQTAELDRLDFEGSVDRFVKAARERNMRILMIRPFSFSADQPVADFAAFIKRIHDELIKRDLKVGHPHTFSDPAVPRVLFPVLGLLVAGVSFYVASELFQDRRVLTVLLVLLALVGLACVLRSGRQVVALLASGAFPVAGFVLLDKLSLPRGLPKALEPLPGYVMVSLASVLGGLCVAGLLNGLPYLVKAEEFKGIKISIFLPILIVGWVYVNRLLDRDKLAKSPITWGSLALGAFVVGLLAVMLARTGNDSSVAASGGELELRGFLDTALFVRPRTKEFLVGNPALYLAVGLLALVRQRAKPGEGLASWTVLALMIGSIGQTSVVNTLCHLHIPVALSLARIFIGLGLGCIIGIVLWAFTSKALARGNT